MVLFHGSPLRLLAAAWLAGELHGPQCGQSQAAARRGVPPRLTELPEAGREAKAPIALVPSSDALWQLQLLCQGELYVVMHDHDHGSLCLGITIGYSALHRPNVHGRESQIMGADSFFSHPPTSATRQLHVFILGASVVRHSGWTIIPRSVWLVVPIPIDLIAKHQENQKL